MDEKEYGKEVYRHLGDVKTYRKLSSDPFPRLIKNLNNKPKFAGEAGLLILYYLEGTQVPNKPPWETYYLCCKKPIRKN